MMAGHREHSRRLKIHAALSFGYSGASEETLTASEFDLLKVFASAHSSSPRSTAQSSSNLQISGPSWRSAAFLRRLAASGQRFRWRLLEAASPFGVASVVAA
jgi:hypothetical protein